MGYVAKDAKNRRGMDCTSTVLISIHCVKLDAVICLGAYAVHKNMLQILFSKCFFTLCVFFILACHVLDCPHNLSYDVINTIGQAFELRYKMFLDDPPQLLTTPKR